MRNPMSRIEGMTNRRPGFRRIAKWVGTAVCVLIFAAWLVSVPTILGGALSIQRSDANGECNLCWGCLCGESMRGFYDEPIWDIEWSTEGIADRNREHYGL